MFSVGCKVKYKLTFLNVKELSIDIGSCKWKLRPPYSRHLAAIGHDDFMRLLGGTFSPTTHEEDVLALMKRANVVIFGRRAVYLRKACPEPSKAKVIHYPELDDRNLLTSDMTERMRAYKRAKRSLHQRMMLSGRLHSPSGACMSFL